MSITIAFNTANLVAQHSGWRFRLADWGKQEAQVIERTDVEAWEEICARVASCGYTAMEVWMAHLRRCDGDEPRAARFLRAAQSHGLSMVALAGAMTEPNAELCVRLGIPAVCGGYWGSDHDTSVRLMRRTGVLYNYENHAETSLDELRGRIDGGADGLAIALDTGWLVTQGIDPPKAVRSLGRLIRHVHVKDAAGPGDHHTAKLGTGRADIPGVIAELKAIGYRGVLSWEDEPEDRNPWDIAAEMRQFIQQLWSRA